MNQGDTVLIVLAGGATGATTTLTAADHITGKTIALAVLAFIVGCGAAVRTFYMPTPPKPEKAQ